MKKPLISIIVPVFNAGVYLEQCIGSIVKQTLTAIEIIIVNDGSTDASQEIIQYFARQDDRIIFIDSQNCGSGCSRNKGLRLAQGEYIGFVDADDWIEPRMFEILYNKAKENASDLVICNANQVDYKKSAVHNRLNLEEGNIQISDRRESVLIEFMHFKYDFANWNKLYVRDIIMENSLFFQEKMALWEDLLFNLLYLEHCNLATIINAPLYNYRIQPSSSMSKNAAQVSKHYNILYKSYLKFPRAKPQRKLIDIFKKELSDSCINNTANFVQFLSGPQPDYVQFIRRFNKAIKGIDKEIYSYKGTPGIEKQLYRFLLRYRSFFIISVLVATRRYVKFSTASFKRFQIYYA